MEEQGKVPSWRSRDPPGGRTPLVVGPPLVVAFLAASWLHAAMCCRQVLYEVRLAERYGRMWTWKVPSCAIMCHHTGASGHGRHASPVPQDRATSLALTLTRPPIISKPSPSYRSLAQRPSYRSLTPIISKPSTIPNSGPSPKPSLTPSSEPERLALPWPERLRPLWLSLGISFKFKTA